MKNKFLDLGNQPITNRFLLKTDFDDEYFFNLSVGFDTESKLVSLVSFVEANTMFDETYAHRASMSTTMTNSFQQIAKKIENDFHPQKILEIGSNDGVFIKHFPKERVLAVEPCSNLASYTNSLGYQTYDCFLTSDVAEAIKEEHGPIDVIYAANTMSHIPDLYNVFESIALLLGENGIFIFEDPSIYEVLQMNSYDQFYDEHAHIFSVLALTGMLDDCGLRIFEIENLKTHGGSNRIYAKKTTNKGIQISQSVGNNLEKEQSAGLNNLSTYLQFSERVFESKSQLVSLLGKYKNIGKKIISYGATYKSSTIFNYCGINTDFIDYIVDNTPGKQGKYSPGVHLPIVSPEEGFDSSVDYAFLGAWNFREEIMTKEKQFLDRGGNFITHVPYVRVI